MQLGRAVLGRLPEGVARPPFDVAQVYAGIVHLGLGGFARAHLARYTHDVLAGDPGWGIIGVGLRASDASLIAALEQQDRLYTLVEQGERREATVIGSLAGVIDASASRAALLAAIDDPAIRIVSLTVTENGYCLDRASKTLDRAHPDIAHDAIGSADPRSVPGILVEAYRRRWQAGSPAFTAMSCDNIQHNGGVLRAAVLTLAAARDPALAAWIGEAAAFPNTMVDRITPSPTRADRERLAARTGMHDQAVVAAEAFRQWVIEDRFAAGRPAWDRAGAQFVTDVAPYEKMKLCLLNASHLAIAALGQLAGIALIHDVMAEPRFARYMAALIERETGPTLAPVPGIDLAAYCQQLIVRFANPAIRDTTQRVTTDAPLNYLLDPLRDRLRDGAPVPLLALAIAAWCRRLRGVDEQGQPIALAQPLGPQVQALAMRDDSAALLGTAALFGDAGRDASFVAAVRHWSTVLATQGARAAAAQALA